MIVKLNYCAVQEQNGTNGSTSNGNGCPVRDPYEDLVTLDIVLTMMMIIVTYSGIS